MRIAVVTPRMASGETGGAEALYRGLVESLRSADLDAEQVQVEIDESSFDAVLQSYMRCFSLDLHDYDLVISTKAPTFMVRHPNHVSYLLHTIRVFYDMFDREFGAGTPEHHRQRALIHELDKQGLHPENVRKRFTNGVQTYQRLLDADPFWHSMRFEAVHHPPALCAFHDPRPGRYVFLPSRLHRWKRVDLVIKAFQYLDRDIDLKIAGTGEDEAQFRALAGSDRRIQFIGRVSDDQLLDLYAGALVVPFVPYLEDYGLVTVEAFRSQKPVITCTDSGEPARLVRNFETGFVVDPDPRAIAERITYLVDHPQHAAEMGHAGCASVSSITWESVISKLVPQVSAKRFFSPPTAAAGGAPTGNGHISRDQTSGRDLGGEKRDGMLRPSMRASGTANGPCNVLVLDMQPIDPPVGGGRIRLLGLYHGLGKEMPTTYLGTYDWPGEPARTIALSDSLTEIDVPLTSEHHNAADEWRRRAGGKTIIDVSFDLLGHLSPEFVDRARRETRSADVVVFSHPWVYPLVKDELRGSSQLIVYDSQNVEGLLRTELLDDGAFGTEMARHVAEIEYQLCHEADLVLCCSHEDEVLFHELYGVPFTKMLEAPNGTFTGQITPADATRRADAKRLLGLPERPLALFMGSAYQPNVEAADYILQRIASVVPEVTFAICGGVGDALANADDLPSNVHISGRIDEAERRQYFAAADIAINPMFSGSGTNVKMFDYMAAGLPIVTTPVGARGIAQTGETAFVAREADEFAAAIRELLADQEGAGRLRHAARQAAEQLYSWERISRELGTRLQRTHARLGAPAPRFSIVIPTYERHDRLWEVLECLAGQTFRDFEVIVVDQSSGPWDGCDCYSDLDLFYVHTDVRGAIHARNTGATYALGEIIAFTDDDCLPLPDWLERAASYFEDPTVVGVEGLIVSARRDDPEYRAVTNEGFEGMGFMTANLFVRREAFLALDGFDLQFDHPHFREDTDLGWRMMQLGIVPFGRDVRVYHPPHRRDTDRESAAERARFFEKDALLLRKHPAKYRSLFLNEAHYLHTEGFRDHFLRGAAKYGVPIDDFYLALLQPLPQGSRERAD